MRKAHCALFVVAAFAAGAFIGWFSTYPVAFQAGWDTYATERDKLCKEIDP